MGIYKILDQLKNHKNSMCPFSKTFHSCTKVVRKKKKMINLHEFEEKFSLTAKISYKVLCYEVLFKAEKA